MNINFFEGGRRIAIVIAGISIVVYLVYVFDHGFNFKDLGGFLLWLLGLKVFTITAGWIVRGFFGIHRGQDFRPNRESKS